MSIRRLKNLSIIKYKHRHPAFQILNLKQMYVIIKKIHHHIHTFLKFILGYK